MSYQLTYTGTSADETRLIKERAHVEKYKAISSFEGLMEMHKDFSKDYDRVMSELKDVSSATVAQLLLDHGAGLTDKILDAAAGTGLTGRQLKSRGYDKIDALDPSSDMLDIALKAKIYNRVIEGRLGEGDFCISPDTYDHVTMSGALVPAHVKLEGLKELCTAVKPGGFVVFNIKEEYVTQVPMYHNLRDVITKMEAEGWWTKREEALLPYDKDCKAFYFVYQVKKEF